jgi:predicted DCC family thiol-disulfide oxidoreductase YuxK
MRRYSYREDPAVPDFADDGAVMVFDGHCGLCSTMVDFILRHDLSERIRLLPAQSPLGEALFAHYGMKSGDYDSVLLLEDGTLRTKMDASLRLFSLLGWPWKLAGIARILPGFLANPLYDLIARNRIRWFGRRETCRIAIAAERERFL